MKWISPIPTCRYSSIFVCTNRGKIISFSYFGTRTRNDTTQQKQLENEGAMQLLGEHLAHLDTLPWQEKQETLARNLLAGNVFDWGAKEAAALMQVQGFGFQQALHHLQRAYGFAS